MSPRLRWDEVRARRPARRGSDKPQTTDGCHGAGVVCDRLRSHHGLVHAATVSNMSFVLHSQLIESDAPGRTIMQNIFPIGPYCFCVVAGGGRTVAGGDTRITTSSRSMGRPAALLRAVLYEFLLSE